MSTADTSPDADETDAPADAADIAETGYMPPVVSAPRYWLIISLLVLLGCALSAGFAMRVLGEEAGTNSYAVLVDSWLNGQLHSDTCFDGDCATFEGKTYVIFPPAPAAVALPFIALSGQGADFAHFMPLSMALLLAIAFIWSRLFAAAGPDQTRTLILLIALVFSTPLYFVALRGDKVWFFAQLVGFFFVSMALWATIERRNAWLAGAMIGLAFLSRQMTILYAPLLFVLMLNEDEPLFRITKQRIFQAFKLGLPILAAVGVYCLYNFVRFGAPLDTGYGYIATDVLPGEENVITLRISELGLFAQEYFLFNVVYMFFQGLHVEFGGTYTTKIIGVDSFGTSILAASPFLLLLAFVQRHRITFVGVATAAAICGVTLFYHSNGFSQYNVQRYALDWLPIAMLLLAPTVRTEWRAILAVLVGYAMVLNLVTMAAIRISGIA
ncbi:MAG: hypothetical protein ACFB0Z_09380 [Candidatus Phaeomarinobacter sp.]